MSLVASEKKKMSCTTNIKVEKPSLVQIDWKQYKEQLQEDVVLNEHIKPEPIMIVKLESAPSENVCNSYTSSVFTLDESEDFFPTQIPVKIETRECKNEIEETSEIIFDESNIKHEEIDLKQEVPEQKEFVLSSGVINQDKLDEFKKHKCHLCCFRTTKNSYLNAHLSRHKKSVENQKFECQKCNYTTQYRSNLTKHTAIQHKNRQDIPTFKCDQCEYEAIYKSNLTQHLIRHNAKRDAALMCDQCNYKTIHEGYFKTHQMQHKLAKEVIDYKCDHCEYQTSCKINLNTHKLRHHDRKVIKTLCHQCDPKTFENKIRYKRYQLRFRDPKAKCDSCGSKLQ